MASPPVMFSASEICPRWKGQYIVEMREPLLRGLQLLRERLDGVTAIIADYRVEFDYDGPFDRIEKIVEFVSAQAAVDALPALMDSDIEASLAAHPEWSSQEGARQIASGIDPTLPGTQKKTALQVGRFTVGNPSFFEKLYVGYFLLERSKGDLVDQLIAWPEWQEAMVSHLQSLARVITDTI